MWWSDGPRMKEALIYQVKERGYQRVPSIHLEEYRALSRIISIDSLGQVCPPPMLTPSVLSDSGSVFDRQEEFWVFM